MELSQVRFKVLHKPGTSMGHADGLSRLHHRPNGGVVSVIRMTDLLNAEENDAGRKVPDEMTEGTPTRSANNEDVRAKGGETAEGEGNASSDGVPAGENVPVGAELLTQDEQEKDQQERSSAAPSPASLLASALALDPQLRVSDLKMVSHFVVRKVHLEARAGPARTLVVPAVPLPFIETVLRYCHSDIFSAHLGKTKTADKVRRHAYWHGWKKDEIEYVRECSICGGVGTIGPLVVTPRGNKYILLFVDYFTR
ncbi:hypothetical protein PC120_g23983 [Phytophthora cactorum]|nr:hypothetical protein PC120_g23983 [Phytophthora cactorum]